MQIEPHHINLIVQIGGGLLGFAVVILTGIWKEVRSLNSKLQEISLMQVKVNTRIDTIEKIVDKLPCINNLTCPKGDKHEKFYS